MVGYNKILLKRSLKNALNNNLLRYILKDLLWGIIRYKERNWEDSLERFRGFIEHSHELMYNNLIPITSNPIYLEKNEKTPAKVFVKLISYIFPNLNINEKKLLIESRNIYKDSAKKFHEIISDGSQSKFLQLIISCIKLYLLDETILHILKFNCLNALKTINIERKYTSFLNLDKSEIIEIFLDLIFSQRIRDFIFKNTILSYDDIENSRFLQIYFPLYVFNYWKIENLLCGKEVFPFRTIGPLLIDFEKGNWVYIPKTAHYVIELLKKNNKSILISSESGTGKTVISRYVGYSFLKQNYIVFYIDSLEHETNKIENVLDQLLLRIEDEKVKLNSVLFIFENIHFINDELKLKINKFKDSVLCLITERIFREEKKEVKQKLNFYPYQIIRIDLSHWIYKKTIKGIIKLNYKEISIINQLNTIGNQNLWIYAIILKLLNEASVLKKNISIIELFIDHILIGESISEYFENFIHKKLVSTKSSEDVLFLNHIKYFLAILSILSEHELWMEKNFIDYLSTIRDNSVLGILNKELNIKGEILTEVYSFLIDLFEIDTRNVDFKPGIKQKEFKIPHAQMAIIYKNSILKILEKSYPDLNKQLEYLYISHGKYYGSFLQQKYLFLIGKGKFRDFQEINKLYFDFKSFFYLINYNSNPEILQNQIIQNSIEESNHFFFYLSSYDSQLEEELFKNLFKVDSVLLNDLWRWKIIDCKPPYLYLLLKHINSSLGTFSFIEFLGKFKQEIFKKFKEDKGDYIFSFLNLFLPLNNNLWLEFLGDISELVNQTSIDINNLFSIYIRNEEFFGKITKEHKFYFLIKKVMNDLILNINFEEERQFVPSPYYNYGELFSQIYYEILEELISQTNQALIKIYETKLHNTNLINIINYLKDLYETNPDIAIRFFKKFLDLIKNKLYQADVDDIETFFDVLSEFKNEKIFIEKSFLSDWNWFIGIFMRLNNSEFFYFSKFRIIFYFFKDFFPEYLEKYDKFFINESKLRIQEYYENLECKLDIFDRLNVILGDEINNFILNLFNNSIYDSLKTQSLSFYIRTFPKFYLSYSLKELWNFKQFVLSNEFKEKLMQANDNELKEFFNIFRKGEPWRELLFDSYKELLIDRFGQNYEIVMKLGEKNQQIIDHLKAIVNELDILEIVKNYNHYSDPIFSNKKSYFFQQLRKIIRVNYSKFFIPEFINNVRVLNFTDIFNLIIILKVYHPSILKTFCIRNKSIIFNKLNESNEILEVITILKFYKLKCDILKKLDEYLVGDISLYNVVLEAVKKMDLASLRYFIQTNPAGLLKEYTDIDLSNHLKQSSLLHLSIFLYKDELNIALKIPGHIYIRRISFMNGPIKKYPFLLELSKEDLKGLKEKIKSLLIFEYPFQRPETEGISYSYHSNLISKIISEQFNAFSLQIIDLIKQSNVWEIATYFKSLTKILKDITPKEYQIPEELEKYLISEKFKNKIENSEFYDIYRLFKYLKIINVKLSGEIWKRNRNIFESEAFLQKFRNDYIYRVFNFYDMFNDEHYKFSLESIDILKKIMKLYPLRIIIPFFLELSSNDDFNALISVFKEEIINIAKKYSKFELIYISSKDFMDKYNKDSLNIMRTIFQERLNEKYFFES